MNRKLTYVKGKSVDRNLMLMKFKNTAHKDERKMSSLLERERRWSDGDKAKEI